jgi:hypothetical protein
MCAAPSPDAGLPPHRDGAPSLTSPHSPFHHPSPSSLCAEFVDVARATLMGFLVMGFTGYLVKLVHIPINQILVGA